MIFRLAVLAVVFAFSVSARAECSRPTDAMNPGATCFILACDLVFSLPGWDVSGTVVDALGGPSGSNFVGRVWAEVAHRGSANPPPYSAFNDSDLCEVFSRDTSISFEADLRRHGVLVRREDTPESVLSAYLGGLTLSFVVLGALVLIAGLCASISRFRNAAMSEL